MELEKIKGHSYYIKGGTNTGVYVFKDKYVLVIDPGISNSRGNRLIKLFDSKGLRVKYILNTHEHSDHYGASKILLDYYTGAKSIASDDAKTFIDNSYLFSTYVYGGKSNKLLDDYFKNRENKFSIDEVVYEGQIKLNNEKFDIINLKGHSIGSIGILTEDKVLYLGDSLFNESILEKYNFPFLFDISEQLNTLDKIKEIDFDFCVMGHSKALLDKEEAVKLVEINKEVIYKYLNQIREFLTTPYTREDLLKDIIEYNELKLNYKEYYFSNATLSSMISYLVEGGEIDYQYENGKMYYFMK
ncbi:MAG: MBL fold metallo-hydrolase [Tepidibacter sp.]|jgi:glyoxylase-like metal-dependent hydrolase (beta-lactamase superfamily II)|uniref:MBL fold metallo-hydrolase n=1 Tax=Tepidibacter sp. TaxID=2529387 RepID=UPI0025EC0638|nr:MBL fold metallo-hydrolase [Tepidibacter sp.]MCT4508103.1 MBL fold metallo-hydrolase [Tepidibacter sp.]